MTMSGPGFIMGCTCLQIRQSKGHLLVVPPVPECLDLCPIAAFDVYTSACVLGGVDLRVGYLFPPILTAHGWLCHNAFDVGCYPGGSHGALSVGHR